MARRSTKFRQGPPAQPAQILILDPDDQTASTCEQAFKRRGWHVDRPDSLLDATELLQTRRYDVAVVELVLPDTDGLEVWQQVRKSCPGAVCIMMTSSSSLHSSVYALEEGVLTFLLKPLDLSALCNLIDRSMKRQQAAEEVEVVRRQLISLTTMLTSDSRTYDQVVQRALSELHALYEFDWLVIYLFDPHISWMPLRQEHIVSGRKQLSDRQAKFIKSQMEATGHSLKSGLWKYSSKEQKQTGPMLQGLGLRDLVLFPIVASAEPLGVLAIANSLESDAVMAAQDTELFALFGHTIAMALERASLLGQVRAEAVHNAVVGTYTPEYLRCLVGIETARWQRHARPFSLLLLDPLDADPRLEMDGHRRRQRLYRDVADTVRLAVRQSDVVAHLPDWRMAILLPETDRTGAEQAADRVTKAVEERLASHPGGPICPITIKILTPSQETHELEDLLRIE